MPIPSRDAILKVLSKDPNPVRLQSIAAELRVPESEQQGLLRLLDDMVFSGQLIGHSGVQFSVAVEKKSEVARGAANRAPARDQPYSWREEAKNREKNAARPATPTITTSTENGPVSEPPAEEFEFRSRRDERKLALTKKERFADKKKQPAPAPTFSNKNDKGGKSALPQGRNFQEDQRNATRAERRGPNTRPDVVVPSKGDKGGKKLPTAAPEPVGSSKRKVVALRQNEREGYLTVNARGFGFLSSTLHPNDDVFIEGDRMGGAMHGDRVKVAVLRRRERGVEGEVLEIIERGMRRVAGILRRKRASAWLEPDDARIRGPIPLPDDGNAENGEGNSGNDGDLAIVRITRYPEYTGETAVGKLETILGRPGELRSETAKIVALAQVDEIHTDEAFQEASAFGETVPESMLQGRIDLTHLPLPTIDPDDARDHDDAVWVERNGEGYRAWIAIADVSAYVRPGTKLDEEALFRGCSVYLPDRAIPMLPRPLSSNLCSLLPDVTRLCLAVEAELDQDAKVISFQLHRAFMKSQAKLTYGGVARALGLTDKPPVQPKAEEFLPGLKIAYELSKKLRQRRIDRGAIDFEVPESKIVFNDKNEPSDVVRRSEDPGLKQAYQLIEELMLLANEVVAGWSLERDVPTIFRVHAPPSEEKLARFAAMCEVLGVPFDEEDTRDPKRLAAFIRSFAGHPRAAVLNMLLLRSMKQAAYDTGNIGHFGLASTAYLHFTSPIRRYPDVIVHRGVHAVLERQKIARDSETRGELQDAAVRSSQNERRAMEVERDVADLYKAWLMKDRIGERFEGTITGLVGGGAFIALDGPFVDVFVRTDGLGGGSYELSEDGLRLYASRGGDMVQLGDRIVIEIIDVSLSRRQITAKRFGIAERDESADAPWGNGQEKRATTRRFAQKGARPAEGARPGDKDARGGRSQGGGGDSRKPKIGRSGAQPSRPEKGRPQKGRPQKAVGGKPGGGKPGGGKPGGRKPGGKKRR